MHKNRSAVHKTGYLCNMGNGRASEAAPWAKYFWAFSPFF